MKKIIACMVFGLGFVPSTFAGPAVGFSTLQLNWSASGATAVPTMSTYAALLLAVLLALVVFKFSRKRGALVSTVAPLVTFGIAAAFALMTEHPVAGGMGPPAIDGNTCSGSATYTADGPTPPPCFVNTCGSPVTVSYTFIAGETGDATPITAESCTFDYYCDGAPEGPNASQGATVPSDGLPYATAYCNEIFSGIPEDET